MSNCSKCNTGKMERKSKSQTQTFKGIASEVKLSGEWCNSCEHVIFSNEDQKVNEKSIRDFRAQVNGLLTSEEVKAIRKQLKLTQKDAARICGGGPNAFSRYERGEATPIRATSNLLKLLTKYPDELAELLETES